MSWQNNEALETRSLFRWAFSNPTITNNTQIIFKIIHNEDL